MKRKKNEIMRISNALENDRLNVGENFYDLILSDLNKLLDDYFCLIEKPSLTVVREGGSYIITISTSANRIKKFINIPQ